MSVHCYVHDIVPLFCSSVFTSLSYTGTLIFKILFPNTLYISDFKHLVKSYMKLFLEYCAVSEILNIQTLFPQLFYSEQVKEAAFPPLFALQENFVSVVDKGADLENKS